MSQNHEFDPSIYYYTFGPHEAALVVKPYLPRMTHSELFSLMTVGMATVAGSVMLAYVGMLGGGDYAGHLATASLLSAPAGLLLAKVMVPETGTPQTGSPGHTAYAVRARRLPAIWSKRERKSGSDSL